MNLEDRIRDQISLIVCAYSASSKFINISTDQIMEIIKQEKEPEENEDKMKLLEIDCCDECRHARTIYEKGFSIFCKLENRKVKEDINFPNWCPLPNVGNKL